MISDGTLAAAVDQGIVTLEQAERLRVLERAQAPEPATPQDDERLRFISGFGDIFVTMGLALFLGSLAYLIAVAAGAAATFAGISAVSWALAEFFTRMRRMALPSIVLLVVFAVTGFFAAVHLIGGATDPSRPNFSAELDLDLIAPGRIALAALVTAGMVAIHYLRFRVPITVAAGAAALAGAALATLYAAMPGFTGAAIKWLILVFGLAIFALAMRFDMSDPMRLTRRTDIAFWLHLLAAPMIVHPLVVGLGGRSPSLDNAAASAILGVFLALAAVAVLIDRRALLVSGLSYAGYAFGSLISRVGLGDETVPVTLLVLGAFVLILSAGWRPLRGAILRALPEGLVRRLPNPATISAS